MITRLTTPRGLLQVTVKAGCLSLTVLNCAAGEEASAELDGPEDVTGKVRAVRDGGAWHLTWQAGTMPVSGGDVFIGNGGYQSSVFSGGGIHIGSMPGRGRVIVNGVDVTDYVREKSGQGGGGEVKAVLRVPAGTHVSAEVKAGRVAARGSFGAFRTMTQSADTDCSMADLGSLEASSQSGDVEAGTAGPVMISTQSGDITVAAARGAVQAQAMSGDVAVHVTESVSVSARSMSGDVRVTKAEGTRPLVSASSMSGRVRQP